MDTPLYSSLETKVTWKQSEPAIILTAGMKNNVSVYTMENPDAGKVPMESGSMVFTIRDIPDISIVRGEITDIVVPEDADKVSFSVTLPDTFERGYYKGHFIKKDSSGEAVGVYNTWVIVDKAVKPIRDKYMDVNSVRAQFSDLLAGDNKLLDSLEVSAGDIASAVSRCLEQWESIAPRVTSYRGNNFPYTELLRNGTMYMLLQSLCAYLSRNHMQYNAGGVNIDLEARVMDFNVMRKEYEALWRSGMAQAKMEENCNAFNRSLIYQ